MLLNVPKGSRKPSGTFYTQALSGCQMNDRAVIESLVPLLCDLSLVNAQTFKKVGDRKMPAHALHR